MIHIEGRSLNFRKLMFLSVFCLGIFSMAFSPGTAQADYATADLTNLTFTVSTGGSLSWDPVFQGSHSGVDLAVLPGSEQVLIDPVYEDTSGFASTAATQSFDPFTSGISGSSSASTSLNSAHADFSVAVTDPNLQASIGTAQGVLWGTFLLTGGTSLTISGDYNLDTLSSKLNGANADSSVSLTLFYPGTADIFKWTGVSLTDPGTLSLFIPAFGQDRVFDFVGQASVAGLVTPVPVPPSLFLLASGAIGFLAIRRRSKLI